MSTYEISQNASKFYREALEMVFNLQARWQDEHQYEDINDYQKPLDAIAARCGATITGMCKRPFGCTFTTNDAGERKFRLKVTNGRYSYHRIA